MRPTISCIAFLAAFPAFAESTRELDAHEHGVGALNIAVDGSTVAMEFHAPGADIVGFEYVAESDADIATIEAAIDVLSVPLELFRVPAAAACTIEEVSVELESEEAHEAHDHEDEHGDHDHDGEKDHDHDDHEEQKDADHADHEDHDHEDHSDEAGHTEFHAEYTLNCADPSAITSLEFDYFDTFENALEVEVQIITASGAQAFEVERDTPTLDLSGAF